MELKSILKIGLALLLFLCLAHWPYSYYVFIRFTSLIVFSILAIKSVQDGNSSQAFIYFGLAVLFQPFFKIALGRTIWNIVDVIVGIGLIWDVLNHKKR